MDLHKTWREYDAEMRQKKYHYDIPPMPKWVRIRVEWPFAGAAARACFEIEGYPDAYVSTYLDVNDALGVMREPYFEAYPIKGDTFRVVYDEQPILYRRVLKELKRMRRRLKKGN